MVRSVLVDGTQFVTWSYLARRDSPNQLSSKVLVALCLRDEHPDIIINIHIWRRYCIDDGVKQVLHTLFILLHIVDRPPFFCSSVDSSVFALVIRSFQIAKQVKDFRLHFVYS